MTTPTPTPRTDAEATNCNDIAIYDEDAIVSADFARQLEREVYALKAELTAANKGARINSMVNQRLAKSIVTIRDQLRQRDAELKVANELSAKVSERLGGDSKVSIGIDQCGPSTCANYEVGIGANWFCYCRTEQDAKLVVELLQAHRARIGGK